MSPVDNRQENKGKKATPEDREGIRRALDKELEKADKVLAELGKLPGSKSKEKNAENPEKSSEEKKEAEENKENHLEKSLEDIKKLDRQTVAHLIEGGASDEQIISVAERLQEFTKFDGASYYLSDQNKEKHDKEKKHKRRWRSRSAAGHRSDGDVQKNMFEKHIPRELKHYRDLLQAFGGTSDLMRGISYLEKDEGEQPNGMKEKLESLAKSGEYKKIEKSEQKKESSEKISKDDLVYYMEKEMRRWRDPKQVEAIKVVDDEEYAKFADDDSLYPLSKLKRAEDVEKGDTEYRPGPKDVSPSSGDLEPVPDANSLAEEINNKEEEPKEEIKYVEYAGEEKEDYPKEDDSLSLKKNFSDLYVEYEDPEDDPKEDDSSDLEKILSESDDIEDDPDANEIAEEIEKLSLDEREKVDRFWENLGYKAEQSKSWMQKKTFWFFADKFSKKDGDSTLAQWFSALNERAITKERQAISAREERKKSDSKTKEFFKDKWKLTANALKIGSMFFTPHRWFMIGGMALSTGAEAGKEVRFGNEELMEKTRYKDAEKAAEEAWAVYEQAEKLSGEDSEVTKELLLDAYTKHLPENILKRLGEYEEFKFEDETVYDFDKAYEEAMRIQSKAESLAGDSDVSTENMQAAFEKLFMDPKPGQNTAFWGKIFEKQILRLVKKTQYKFIDIEMNDSLTEEQKEQQKQKYLNKWGRSKAFQDYDRMLTEQGKIDNWAMVAHGADRLGKGIVAGTLAFTFWKSLSYLPGLLTSTDAIEEAGESIPDDSNDTGDALPEDVDSTSATEGTIPGASADSTDASKMPEGEPLTNEAADSSQTQKVGLGTSTDQVADSSETQKMGMGDTTKEVKDQAGFGDPTTEVADSTRTEKVGMGDPTEEAAENSIMGESTVDTATDSTAVATEQLDLSEVPKPPLGTQEFIIDEKGEGMIHAIADGLEDKYDISHEKAMELGNKLFIKGEQLKGDDELYNLVGKGATFRLDFADLTTDDLENLSTDELVEKIDFNNEEGFTAGESGIKGLELPEPEVAAESYDSVISGDDNSISPSDRKVEPVTLREAAEQAQAQEREAWEQELKREGVEVEEGSSYETSVDSSAAAAETETSVVEESESLAAEQSAATNTEAEIEGLRTDVIERDTTEYINDRVDDLLKSVPENTSGEYREISVNALGELNEYLDAHREQDIVTTIEKLGQDNPRLLLTLDKVVNVNENPPGSLLDRISGFISKAITEAENEGRLGRDLLEKMAVDRAHLDALASAEVTPASAEEMSKEIKGLNSELDQYADKTNKGEKTRERIKELDDFLKSFERVSNKADIDKGSRFFGGARDILNSIGDILRG